MRIIKRHTCQLVQRQRNIRKQIKLADVATGGKKDGRRVQRGTFTKPAFDFMMRLKPDRIAFPIARLWKFAVGAFYARIASGITIVLDYAIRRVSTWRFFFLFPLDLETPFYFNIFLNFLSLKNNVV